MCSTAVSARPCGHRTCEAWLENLDTRRDAVNSFRSDGDWFAHLYPEQPTFPPEWVVAVNDHRAGPPEDAKIMLCMEPKNDKRSEPWVHEIWR